jgi:hypothetical protein
MMAYDWSSALFFHKKIVYKLKYLNFPANKIAKISRCYQNIHPWMNTLQSFLGDSFIEFEFVVELSRASGNTNFINLGA